MIRIVLVLSLYMMSNITSLYAVDVIKQNSDKKTFNEVDDSYSNTKGFAFYEDSNSSDKDNSIDKKTKLNANLLYEILLENKKQTKLLTDIRDILQKTHDPKPEKIVVNGKECIANSSAECFKMPLTAEAKKVPVLASWIQNPTMENAAKYLKWQAKYFNSINKGGYSLNLASKEGGAETYPIDATPLEFGSVDARSTRFKSQAIESKIRHYSKNITAYIMLGVDSGLDIDYASRTINLYKSLKELGIKTYIIFPSQEYFTEYGMFIKASYNSKAGKEWDSIKVSRDVIIDSGVYKKAKPHTSPYSFIEYKGSDKKFSNVFATGRDNASKSIDSIYRLLVLHDIINPKELHGENIFGKNRRDDFINSIPVDNNKSKRLKHSIEKLGILERKEK